MEFGGFLFLEKKLYFFIISIIIYNYLFVVIVSNVS